MHCTSPRAAVPAGMDSYLGLTNQMLIYKPYQGFDKIQPQPRPSAKASEQNVVYFDEVWPGQ